MRKDVFELKVNLLASASVVGKKESAGPLGPLFDLRDEDDRFGKKTWESAESEMQRIAFNTLLAKSEKKENEIDALFAGDLQNQCVGSAYGLMDFNIPYFGLYGACSTCAEGILLASMAIASGCRYACSVTSSHNCVAERQYRSPLEYGAQRAPTAQWTVTGAGAFLLGKEERGAARISRGCAGRVIEMGVRDLANMGAAMAPAALDTLLRFFSATGERPEVYDCIVTGDLGFEGGAILQDLARAEGIPLGKRYTDCGQLIYDRETQDVHAGGSGCGCSAVVLSAYLLPKLSSGKWRRILFLSTGAMMSPDSIKQGRAIPAIAHLIELEAIPE
ncbi:MAG: stage V sporulation protein AD [Clostridia bacterium]|nr:stage V sporulation protein AD [Clostridia bacterium]